MVVDAGQLYATTVAEAPAEVLTMLQQRAVVRLAAALTPLQHAAAVPKVAPRMQRPVGVSRMAIRMHRQAVVALTVAAVNHTVVAAVNAAS
jgi:hypothetical protein